MANYHPANELLMAFAAGQQSNPLGLMVACHLETCAECRQYAQVYETLGGELMQTLEPVPVNQTALHTLMARLNESNKDSTLASECNNPPIATNNFASASNVPRPLQRFIHKGYDALPWSGMTKSIKEAPLLVDDPVYTAKFYKIAAGKELPEHTHRGNEYTLVMQGSFSDKAGEYKAGDFIHADTTTHHQPKADHDCDCICFAVMDAPLKMTGFFGRFLNPFLR